MKKASSILSLAFLFFANFALAQEPVHGQEGDPDQAAPLLVASDSGPKIEFQVGADAFGGMSNMDFVGGANVTFLYPIIDLLWVGIRPSLHYGMSSDSPYDTTWMHADAIVQVNIINEPVRLYALASGGYSFAADRDLYDKLAHGFGLSAGAGLTWHPEDSSVGLFLELGFRYANASASTSRLLLDDKGHPEFDFQSFSYKTETYDRTFELSTIFVNLGLTVSP